MFVDLTLKVTPERTKDAQGNEKKALTGHLGTHFDVMDKVFPLAFLRRPALVLDVSAAAGRDIEPEDLPLERVLPHTAVLFSTGWLEREGYATPAYFKGHPQLSQRLINALLEREVSLLGIDCAGIRRGREHTPADQRCADRGAFVVENLCNLQGVLRGAPWAACTLYTFPVNFAQMSGLPCRVVAELPEGEE